MSVEAQRFERGNACCAASRDEARERYGRGEDDDDRREDERIARADVEQKDGEEAGDAEREGQAEGEADGEPIRPMS
jgi:hypothetical protein